jgi:hypothetical protein
MTDYCEAASQLRQNQTASRHRLPQLRPQPAQHRADARVHAHHRTSSRRRSGGDVCPAAVCARSTWLTTTSRHSRSSPESSPAAANVTATPQTIPSICCGKRSRQRARRDQFLPLSRVNGNRHTRPTEHMCESAGRLVALLPARCKLGRHALGHSEFRAIVHDGEARISCLACATDSADHFWRLVATTPAPDRAELSEELYLDLVLRRSQAMLASGDGRRAQQPVHRLGWRQCPWPKSCAHRSRRPAGPTVCPRARCSETRHPHRP